VHESVIMFYADTPFVWDPPPPVIAYICMCSNEVRTCPALVKVDDKDEAVAYIDLYVYILCIYSISYIHTYIHIYIYAYIHISG